MTAYSAKSSNGRIEWILDKGRLTEISPESYKFTLTAIDTQILFGLLASGSNDIINAAQMEIHGIKVRKDSTYEEEYFAEGIDDT